MLITNIGVVGLLVLLKTSYPDSMDGTYPLLLVLGALIGCGIATFSVGIGQVSYWFPKKDQGGALGIYGGLGNTSPGAERQTPDRTRMRSRSSGRPIVDGQPDRRLGV